VARIGKELVGPVLNNSEDTLEVRTCPFDFNSSEEKTIQVVDLGTKNLQNVYVTVEWRNDSYSTWRSHSALLVNREGVLQPVVTAKEFRLLISADTSTSVQKLERIWLRFKQTGKRSLLNTYGQRLT
jgi:hypothetical protein